MPVTNVDVRDGDPTVQASGQHRGTVTVTFADGRIFERNIRAPDIDAWNDLVANIGDVVQAQVEKQDAEAAVDPDEEVAASQEATIQQVAVAYLRGAWGEEQAYDAYLKFDRFNTYRLNQGWTLDQVQTNLMAAGLTAEEWDDMKTAYLYLDGGGRPAIMADAKTIQGNWEGRDQ